VVNKIKCNAQFIQVCSLQAINRWNHREEQDQPNPGIWPPVKPTASASRLNHVNIVVQYPCS
jgi:hypothetical protein